MTDPDIIVSALYLPPLLLVALLSRTARHAYGFALGVTALVYFAYFFAQGDAAHPVPISLSWYVGTNGVTFLVVVVMARILVRLTLALQDYARRLDAARAEAWTLAVTDPLTGLANRRSFDARLEEEIHRCGRQGQSLAVLLLDVDHFKEINDQRGHGAGDAALRHVADGLRAVLRAGDLAARVGGDEFGVVLPNVDHTQAHVVARKIREVTATPTTYAGRHAPIQVSIGVASMSPHIRWPIHSVTSSSAALLEEADAAMYREKLGRHTSA